MSSGSGKAGVKAREKKYCDNGYVIFPRKWLGGELAQNPGAFVLFLHLLGWANFKNSKIRIGEILLGIDDFGREFGMSILTVRKWLRWLRDNGWVTFERKCSGKKRGMLVTVLRYEPSQNLDTYKLPPSLQTDRLAPQPLPENEFTGVLLRILGKTAKPASEAASAVP